MAVSLANANRGAPVVITARKEPVGTGCSAETTTACALLRASAATASALMASARSDGRSARAGMHEAVNLDCAIAVEPARKRLCDVFGSHEF